MTNSFVSSYLVATAAFLKMNGLSIDITNRGLVSMADRAGVATATLSEIETEVRKLVKNE